MTVRQAAQLLGVSEPTLRKWTDAGRIAAFRTPGGHRRFLLVEIERFRDSRAEDNLDSEPDGPRAQTTA